LVLHSVDFPKTHDLQALLGKVPLSVGLNLSITDMNLLSSYAIEGRYPGNWDPPTSKEAESALEIARQVREAVRKSLPKEPLI
jgi:HEPN domain-containing protein